MNQINLIFPHQLLADSPLLKNGFPVYLIEEHLFFKEYAFHKQKIAFHRATMKNYQTYLETLGIEVRYVDTNQPLSDIQLFSAEIENRNIQHIHVIDPVDNWLSQRLKKASSNCKSQVYDNPIFLETTADLDSFFQAKKAFHFQTSFYKAQRKKYNLLLDEAGSPVGGQWTYDAENRKKYPKNKIPPAIHFPNSSSVWQEAVEYTHQFFPNNPGEISNQPLYPISFEDSQLWLDQFLAYRFFDFGAYEDAIVLNSPYLHHSLLSPLMNVGLILPRQVLDQCTEFAKKEGIPINSLEGFVRQIIGWREFIRGMYLCKGSYARTKNFWNFKRKIPSSFYDGTTGILPIDETIKTVLQTGYCHHIERLMVLGNFMLLCEFDPDEVYRWFMELFIDAYDWVMVPNVYGMSQFADGGTFATKPYISGSNYLKKMSNYPSGPWEKIWDGLFWRFMDVHQDFFKANPRSFMLFYAFGKLSSEKKQEHLNFANDFLLKLDGEKSI